MKLAILNSDPKECTYGGVAPIMRNMHPFLSKEFEIDYFYTPSEWDKIPGPKRIKTLIYFLSVRKKMYSYDFILSHIPEGSYVASFTHTPYAHIYHGNTNPMKVSRFKLGKYFAFIYNLFFKRIEKTAAVSYTIGPSWGNVKKMWNPISHSVKVKAIEERSGFIFAGRLEAPKNIDRIIRIYTSLPTSIINRHDLFIAGSGTQEELLKQKAQSTGIGDKIHFLGRLDNESLIEKVSSCALMLMASEYEGMPTAIAEALSVGVPVVTTAAGDIPSVIKDAFNGVLLNISGSDEEYRIAIITALEHLEMLSKNAIESAKVFDAAAIVKDFVSDVTSILNSHDH